MTAEIPLGVLLEGVVPAPAAARLERYGELLERWGERHNLVHFTSRRELVERHLLESLALRPAMRPAGRLVDVGSGAGLPGVPLLCACPGWSGVLLEPRTKRWAFLKKVVRELGLPAEVVAERYQSWAGDAVDLVTARAVGGHEALLEWAAGRLRSGGEVALWTTEEVETTLRGRAGWRVVSSALVGLERGRLVRFQVCFT